MKNYFLFIALCFSFTQCENKATLPVYQLTASNQIDAIADTLLFRDIECLTFHAGRVFFTNPMDAQVISLDKNFNLLTIIGKKGQGPGELLGISQFATQDTILSVLNPGIGGINTFSINGTLLSETRASKSILFNPNLRFCLINTAIVGSSSVAETPLSTYEIDTEEQKLFGETYQFSTPKQTAIRNNRFTAKIDNGILTVSDNQPFIEIYDPMTLKRTAFYDYSDIPQVKSSIQSINKKPDQEDNSYRLLCQDICATDQHLYTMLIDFSKNDFNVNQIIQFEIYPTLKAVCVYNLSKDYYTTFCVAEKEKMMYAYNHTRNTIEMFPMHMDSPL